MRNPTRRAALALVTMLLAGTARAGAPTPAPTAPPPQIDVPAPTARPSQEEVQASLDAIGAADTRRLLTDGAYAAELLGRWEQEHSHG